MDNGKVGGLNNGTSVIEIFDAMRIVGGTYLISVIVESTYPFL